MAVPTAYHLKANYLLVFNTNTHDSVRLFSMFHVTSVRLSLFFDLVTFADIHDLSKKSYFLHFQVCSGCCSKHQLTNHVKLLCNLDWGTCH